MEKTISFGLLSVIVAATLASSLLVLLAAAEPARAAFPETNGKIAFERLRDDSTWEIYAVDPDGSNPINLTDNQAQNDIDPAFSTDGRKIAFASDRDGSYSVERSSPMREIYVMNSDGSNPTRLTNDQALDVEPAFSPDGKKIAFKSDRDGSFAYNDYAIYVMDSDGSNLTRLTTNQAYNNDGNPVFSPDGKKIAFMSERDGNPEIYVMNTDGTDQTRLTNNSRVDADPAFSPDGKKIAFTSSRDRSGGEIYLMNTDGTEQTGLTYDTNHRNAQPAFAPDGKKITFGHQYRWDPHHAMIAAINVDGTDQVNLTTIPPGDSPRDFDPDWARMPDSSEQCTISGTEGNDVLEGTEEDDVICGLGGNDKIMGLGGNDTLRGGDGKDTLKGGEGDDTLDGGAGTDTASYQGSATGVKASLTANTATGEGSDTFTAIEHLTGSYYDDELTGSEQTNSLQGSGGKDTLSGQGGADALSGGSAADTLKGGSGNDKLTGGSGADKLFGDEDDDALNSQDSVSGNDALDGGAGTNTCTTDATEASITNCQ